MITLKNIGLTTVFRSGDYQVIVRPGTRSYVEYPGLREWAKGIRWIDVVASATTTQTVPVVVEAVVMPESEPVVVPEPVPEDVESDTESAPADTESAPADTESTPKPAKRRRNK